MPLTLYQVDAFADRLFTGNPAAVIKLDAFLTVDLMQSIAMENNLSETAYVVPRGTPGQYDLRWFTPKVEIEFCGHATIATAHILFTEYQLTPPYDFHTQIGLLSVDVVNGKYAMRAPIVPFKETEITPRIKAAFPVPLSGAFLVEKYLFVVFKNAADIANFIPNMTLIAPLSDRGVGITATDVEGYDCISRYFVPELGVDEDPVTGSAHARLGPYWSKKLNKTSLKARQASQRGGDLWLEVSNDHITVSGYALTYMRGEVEI